MISKDELYNFLVKFGKEYNNTAEYFRDNPYNEYQHDYKNYEDFRSKHDIYVGWAYRQSGMVSHDVRHIFDLSEKLATVKDIKDAEISVYSTDRTKSYSPDDDIFIEAVKLFLKCGDNYERDLYTDIVSIDGMSYMMYDLHKALDTHAEPHRLKRNVLYDLYVPRHSPNVSISTSERYDDELIDEIESLSNKVEKYWFGDALNDPIEHSDEFFTWDDLCSGKVSSTLCDENTIYLCQHPPHTDLNDDTEKLTNLVNYMIESKDRFMCILFARALTNARIMMTYKKVPAFSDFVSDYALYVREIRYMHE